MVIISKTRLADFERSHSSLIDALNDRWFEVKAANWASFQNVRKTFNSVDYVGNDRYVFNIKGNRYRLVAMIFFDVRTIFIRFVGTHAEYYKIDCKTV